MNVALEIFGALALIAWAFYFLAKHRWMNRLSRALAEVLYRWIAAEMDDHIRSNEANNFSQIVVLGGQVEEQQSINSRLDNSILNLTTQLLQQQAEIDQLNLILNESKPAEKPVTEIRAKSWREFQEIANR